MKHSAVPMESKLLLTLWTLGNQESFRGIGERFGINRGSAHYAFFDMCNVLSSMTSYVIKWPSIENAGLNMSAFEEK